ncbi:MAG: DUF4405 domain-containing protein [Sedimentisphaerales bacterium]|nr:DUF4405 domain-containing protein [Sedimentisphaerales bacterium]
MNKVKVNYILDAVIGVAFILSSVTGIAFLFMGSGGYQGGRNPGFATALWGIPREAWSDLHLWTSFIMIAGTLAHLLLHWEWVVCVTKQFLQVRKAVNAEEVCAV